MTDADATVECTCAEQRLFLAQIRIVLRRVVTDRNAALRRGRVDRRQKRQMPCRRLARKRIARRDGSHSQPTGSNHPHRKASCRRQNAGAGRNRASNCPWRSEAPAALPHRRCGLDATRSGDRLRAAAYSVGAVGHPLRARAFSGTSAGGVFRHNLSRRIAGRSRGSFRSPRNCNRKEFSATGFTASRANRSCANLPTICRTVS